MELIQQEHGLPKETVSGITMLCKITKAMVRSHDDIDFLDIVVGVWQRDALVPHLVIICQSYKLRISVDQVREKGFTLKKGKNQMISHRKYDKRRLYR